MTSKPLCSTNFTYKTQIVNLIDLTMGFIKEILGLKHVKTQIFIYHNKNLRLFSDSNKGRILVKYWNFGH